MIRDNILFVREALSEFQKTGTIFPTSRWAAATLCRPLRKHSGPCRILELGPGNGSVTVKILDGMRDGDSLTICEINPRFMKALKGRLRRHPRFRELKKKIRFFCGAAQDLPEDGHYDLIICALPFLNFSLVTVTQIFDKIMRIRSPECVMTYYEYIGIRYVSKVIASRERKARMRQLDTFFHGLSRSHAMRRHPVWLNVLPINIYSVEFAAA
jgi:phospholipid N-methyltransferase